MRNWWFLVPLLPILACSPPPEKYDDICYERRMTVDDRACPHPRHKLVKIDDAWICQCTK